MRATTDEHESRQRRVERGSCENVLYFLRNYSSVISSILQCFRFYKISLIQKNACRIFQIAEVVAKLFQRSSRMIPVFLEIFQKSADWRDQSKFTWNVQTMCRLCAEALWISPAFLKRGELWNYDLRAQSKALSFAGSKQPDTKYHRYVLYKLLLYHVFASIGRD